MTTFYICYPTIFIQGKTKTMVLQQDKTDDRKCKGQTSKDQDL